MTQRQFLRKASLLLHEGDKALDLSQFKFSFVTQQADAQSPNNCEVTVYNLSEDTVRRIQGEYSRIALSAGYEDNFGLVFNGTIRQFAIGMSSPKDTYLKIYAADSEYGYNNAVVNESIAAGASIQERLTSIATAFKKFDIDIGFNGIPGDALALQQRGKVQFGLARTALNSLTKTVKCSWSIQNGKINIIPLDGYLPGEAVVLNRDTGLIGRPELTAEGIKGKCLLNPRLVPGGLIKIDQKSVNRTIIAPNNVNNIVYNSNTQTLYLPSVAADGLYRLYVVEFSGDTRGTDWYCNFVALAVNALTFKVKPYG